jgi:hypothetical protein
MVWFGALLLLTPFLRATSTFFVSDDIQMVLFGATASRRCSSARSSRRPANPGRS